jgi:hypothetical protein
MQVLLLSALYRGVKLANQAAFPSLPKEPKKLIEHVVGYVPEGVMMF